MKKTLLKFVVSLISVIMCSCFMTAVSFAEAEAPAAAPHGSLTKADMIRTVPGVDTADSDELLVKYFDSQVNSATSENPAGSLNIRSRKLARTPRRSRLNHIEQYIYDAILAKMEAVAAGKDSSTEINIDLSEPLTQYMTESDEFGYRAVTSESLGISQPVCVEISGYYNGEYYTYVDFSDEAKSKLYDLSRVVDAVLTDNPYPAYWFDKTDGYIYGLNYLTDDSEAGVSDIYFYEEPNLYIGFTVAQGYRAGSAEYTADTNKTGAAASAAANAESVITNNSALGDLEKLCAYKDAICSLTSYNYEAAENDDMPYGDPWQLIWVFDGDDSTEVVCEGYAKAFQYLCDKSGFNNEYTECRTVTGIMSGGTGAGGHMWNILHMDDGKNYIADITNCDVDDPEDPAYPSDGVYPDDYMFKGYYSVTSAGGYVYADGVQYDYDNETLAQYSAAELAMSASDYDPDLAEGFVTRISYSPVNGRTDLAEGIDGYDESGVFIYKIPLAEGDTLNVSYSGEAKPVTYTYVAEEGGEGEFVAQGAVPSGASQMIADTDILQHTNKDAAEDWKAGGSYEAVLSYLGCTCKVQVNVVCGHDYGGLIAGKEATCVSEGIKEHYKCSKCGRLFVKSGASYVETTADALKIPATGRHTWGAAAYSWNADYTEVKGTHACTVCGHTATASAKRAGAIASSAGGKNVITYTSEAFVEEGFEIQTIKVETGGSSSGPSGQSGALNPDGTSGSPQTGDPSGTADHSGGSSGADTSQSDGFSISRHGR